MKSNETKKIESLLGKKSSAHPLSKLGSRQILPIPIFGILGDLFGKFSDVFENILGFVIPLLPDFSNLIDLLEEVGALSGSLARKLRKVLQTLAEELADEIDPAEALILVAEAFETVAKALREAATRLEEDDE